MSVKSKLQRFLDLKSRRRASGKKKAKRQSGRRLPPRNKNGCFKKRS